MAEECKNPSKIFPKVLLTGLLLTGLIYVLVSISAITLVPAAELGEGETPLLKVVSAGAPGFPLGVFGIITMFAVANSALINMLMASRLVYGMSREGVLPPILGRVHRGRRTPYIAIAFTSLLAFGLITFVGAVPALGGTTALLLLGVFTIVNVAVLVLRKDKVDHEHFQHPDDPASPGRSLLRLPRRALDRPRHGAILDCRHSARHRRRSLASHVPGHALAKCRTGGRRSPADHTYGPDELSAAQLVAGA